jgi:hypothetical protein
MFAHGSSLHQKCFDYALTNLLFDLCRSVWIIDLLVTHPSPHLGALGCPSTFEVLQPKECAPTPYPSVVFTLDSHLNLSRSLGVHQWKWHPFHSIWVVESWNLWKHSPMVYLGLIEVYIVHIFFVDGFYALAFYTYYHGHANNQDYKIF